MPHEVCRSALLEFTYMDREQWHTVLQYEAVHPLFFARRPSNLPSSAAERRTETSVRGVGG